MKFSGDKNPIKTKLSSIEIKERILSQLGQPADEQFFATLEAYAKQAPIEALECLIEEGLSGSKVFHRLLTFLGREQPSILVLMLEKFPVDSSQLAAFYTGLKLGNHETEASELLKRSNPNANSPLAAAEVSTYLQSSGYGDGLSFFLVDRLGTVSSKGNTGSMNIPGAIKSLKDNYKEIPSSTLKDFTKEYFRTDMTKNERRFRIGADGLICELTERDPKAAANFVVESLPQEARHLAFDSLMSTWAKKDAAAALNFVSSYKSSVKEQTQMLYGILNFARGQDNGLVQECEELLTKISKTH